MRIYVVNLYSGSSKKLKSLGCHFFIYLDCNNCSLTDIHFCFGICNNSLILAKKSLEINCIIVCQCYYVAIFNQLILDEIRKSTKTS